MQPKKLCMRFAGVVFHAFLRVFLYVFLLSILFSRFSRLDIANIFESIFVACGYQILHEFLHVFFLVLLHVILRSVISTTYTHGNFLII